MVAAEDSELLSGLNPVQREAVTAPPDGPLLVVAGAGSGKTRVLTHRIAYLIREQKVSPFEILAITFTNKAAGEMKERVGRARRPGRRRRCGCRPSTRPVLAILRREAPVLGYRSSFSIYDQSDAVRLVDYVRRDLNLDPKRFPARRLHGQISALKNELITAEATPVGPRRRPRTGWPRSTTSTSGGSLEASAADFDDLLLLAVRLFREHPDVLERWRNRFSHILVDEFQDTNLAQWELVRLLAEEPPQRHGRRRQRSVPRAGHQGHDGRRLAPAHRAGRRWRRGAVVLRQRRLPGFTQSRECTALARSKAWRSPSRAAAASCRTPEHIHFAGFGRPTAPEARLTTAAATAFDRALWRPAWASSVHRISLFGYDDEGRLASEGLGLSVRPARKGTPGWRYETSSADLGVVMDRAKQIQSVLDVSVRCVARLAANGNTAETNSLPLRAGCSGASGDGHGRRDRGVRPGRRGGAHLAG